MARLVTAMRPDDRQDPAVSMVIGAMAPSTIEEDETHPP
jgi:hypothetical protein